MMKHLCTLVFMVFCICATNAQFAISTKYNANSYNQWDEVLGFTNTNDSKFMENGYELGLSYWFRLKKKRLEFYPEVFYSTQKTQPIATDYGLDRTFDMTGFGFQFNTQIYPLDFDGDCNCPTFSKDGDFIQKGFFIGVSPGVASFSLERQDMEETVSQNQLAFRIGAYMGLDIGINKWITISPIIQLNYVPAIEWEGLLNEITLNKPLVDETSNGVIIQPGLRFTFRPDFLREQRRMFR